MIHFANLQTFPKISISLTSLKSYRLGAKYFKLRALHSGDERWTGLGFDWIRTIANFGEFGLDPDCKSLQNLGSGPDLDC